MSSLVEDEMKCQDQASEEAVTGGTLAEGHECGFEVGVLSLLVPVLQSGSWQPDLLSELSLRGMAGLELVEGMRGKGPRPAKGLWPRGDVGVKLRESHGWLSLGVSCGKDTVGTAAILVQGLAQKNQIV